VSNSLVALVKPLIEEYTAFLAEKQFALFYEAHGQPFGITYLQCVRFSQWFIEQTDLPFDFLFVDSNVQLTEELIEIEFDEVALQFANFQAELHTGSN